VPLDQALGLEALRRRVSRVKQLACAFAVFVPFATAAALLKTGHRRFHQSGDNMGLGADSRRACHGGG